MHRDCRTNIERDGLMLLAVSLWVLPACAGKTYTDRRDDVVDPPRSYTAEGIDGLETDRWCSDFGQKGLERAVRRAWEENLELKAAWARIERARAEAAEVRSNLWPTLSTTAGATVSNQAGSLPDSVGGSQGGASTRYEASLAASYEVDVWGRFRKRAKAAKLEARAVRADARALAMTMTSRVADAWFDAVAARRQLELIDRQIEASKELLELTKVRYRRGLAEELDVIQQEQNVESLRGERARAELSLETAEHRLAVLTGREPGEDVEIGPETLPDLPALPEPGVPADLLTRRPDVRAALVRLKAADRRTAAAVADRLPRVKLSTSLLAQATQVGDLLDRLIWSATGTVSQSIFEGGRLKAAQRRAESEAERRLYAYGQTVLEALKDVRDALVGERRQKEVVASLEREQAKAKEALASARAQFREGAVDYFRVLEALQQLQSVQRELVRARRDQISYRTSLCRAIGGSWADSVDPLGGEDSE